MAVHTRLELVFTTWQAVVLTSIRMDHFIIFIYFTETAKLVGEAGFEPTAYWVWTNCSSHLSYSPIFYYTIQLSKFLLFLKNWCFSSTHKKLLKFISGSEARARTLKAAVKVLCVTITPPRYMVRQSEVGFRLYLHLNYTLTLLPILSPLELG